MEKTNPRLRDEIGGRWALSLTTGLWTLPAFIFGTPFIETHPLELKRMILWSAASSASWIPAAIFVWIAHNTYFKDRAIHPKPLSSVIAMGAIAGTIKGILLGTFAVLFGADNTSGIREILLRGLNSAFIGSVAFPMLSLFMIYRTRYVLDRAAIIKEILRLDAQTMESKAIERSLREGTIDDMNKRVNAMLKVARAEFEDAKDLPLEKQWERLTYILRDTALKTVRPMSHSIFRKLDGRYSNLRILKYVIYNARIEVLWVILFYLVTNIRNTVLLVGAASAVGVLVARVALLALLLIGVNAFHEQSAKIRPYLFVFGGAAAIGLYGIGERAINRFFKLSVSPAQITLELLWIALLILVSGYFSALVNQKKIESHELANLLKKGQLATLHEERRNWETAHALAKHLHGTVQSRLMGSAMAIENAGRKGDIAELNKQIESAYEHLQFDSIGISNLYLESLASVESDISSKWDGLMKVTFNNLLEGELDQDILRDLSQVTAEALSNSFRHGGATEVAVSFVGSEAKGIDISISDNGSGYFPKDSGLGSEYFNLIGGSQWSITNNIDSSGATLLLRIAGQEK